MTSSPHPISSSNIKDTHLMRPKKIDISQAPATNQPTQNIPLFQDYMMIICFACYVFLLIVLCNLTYESNFLFILLTYYLYCTTLISNRYTTNTLTLANTDTEHQRTTHTNNTDNTTAGREDQNTHTHHKLGALTNDHATVDSAGLKGLPINSNNTSLNTYIDNTTKVLEQPQDQNNHNTHITC